MPYYPQILRGLVIVTQESAAEPRTEPSDIVLKGRDLSIKVVSFSQNAAEAQAVLCRLKILKAFLFCF